jgi:hypothetical protein
MPVPISNVSPKSAITQFGHVSQKKLSAGEKDSLATISLDLSPRLIVKNCLPQR